MDALEKAFLTVGEKRLLDVKELDSVEPDLLKKMLKHWIQHTYQATVCSDSEAGDVGPSKPRSEELEEASEDLKQDMGLPDAQPDEQTATPVAEKQQQEAAESSEEEFSREQWIDWFRSADLDEARSIASRLSKQRPMRFTSRESTL